MYPTLRSPAAARGQELTLAGGPLGRLQVSRNVVYLGLTSMFTDISSEMVNAILPLYLVVQLGIGPLAYGFFAGGYLGITALGRVVSGIAGDRGGRHKQVAAAGYALSAICKLGVILANGAALATSAVLYADRIGKGVRTTPRDALISLSTPPQRLGEAFGVHRALDTAGAVFGPVVAFGLLTLTPLHFTAIFAVSLAFAVIGLVMLLGMVRNPARETDTDVSAPRASLRALPGLLRRPGMGAVAVVAALLGAATIGDSFVYLAFQNRTGMNVGYFPLLYVGTSASYLVLAIPAGRIADRIGRPRVFMAGYVALFGVYALLLLPSPGLAGVIIALLLFGLFYAATDGVLMAITSTLLPAGIRGTGLATISTVVTLMQFGSSVAFGALWAWQGPFFAVRVFGIALLAAIALSAALLPRPRRIEDVAA